MSAGSICRAERRQRAMPRSAPVSWQDGAHPSRRGPAGRQGRTHAARQHKVHSGRARGQRHFGRHRLGAGVPAFPAPARRFPRSSDPRRNRYAPQGTRAAGGTVGARARGPVCSHESTGVFVRVQSSKLSRADLVSNSASGASKDGDMDEHAAPRSPAPPPAAATTPPHPAAGKEEGGAAPCRATPRGRRRRKQPTSRKLVVMRKHTQSARGSRPPRRASRATRRETPPRARRQPPPRAAPVPPCPSCRAHSATRCSSLRRWPAATRALHSTASRRPGGARRGRLRYGKACRWLVPGRQRWGVGGAQVCVQVQG